MRRVHWILGNRVHWVHLVTRLFLAATLLVSAAPLSAQQRRPAPGPDLRLIEAVRSQDRARAGALIKQGVDVNVAQPDGATALHWAVHWEDAAPVGSLLAAGANPRSSNDLGVTPLLMAASAGNGPLMERLLAAGADANASLESGETALMLASRAGSEVGVRALLAGGAMVNARERTRGQTALMWAIADKHPAVTRLLLDHGADIHVRSETRTLVYNMGGNRSAGSAAAETPLEEVPLGGGTAMMFAARSGDTESARLLVARGANVNDTGADGNTALIVAAHSGHGTLAAFLLGEGADAKAAPLGYTALHAAVLRGTWRDRGVRNDDPGAGLPLVRALLARGADPNARVTKGTPVRRWSHDFALLERWIGATPMWLAARFLEIDMVAMLEANGGNVHLTTRDGTTPLMAAAGTGYSRASGTEAFIKDRRDFSSYNSEPFAVATRIPADEERLVIDMIRLLLERGADVTRSNAAGDTAVHAAAALGMNTVLSFLSERGADLSARNKAGRSPIDVARRDDGVGASVVREDTVAVLRKLGAR
jgi:ankyrin repeat protein